MEHRGQTSFLPAYADAGFNHNTRCLQFSSYAYAACMIETFATLMSGGCLCIPSQDDRVNNISGFIENHKVNYAILLPSFAKTIPPDSVPSLKTLITGGEGMTLETRDIWAGRVRLLNLCGQSECHVSGVGEIKVDTPDVRIIGRGAATRLWIVDPDNIDRLVPVGCPGELVVEGKQVSRGYLGQPELTATKFVTEAPSWYSQRYGSLESAKIYRTGDLACYLSDGTVVCLGREDSQVKIRGQRVELGEVEHHLRKITPPDVDLVVEMIKAPREALVAFLIGPLKMPDGSACQTVDSEAFIVDNDISANFTAQMENDVGRHAIPSYYVSLNAMPTGVTGKTDRKKLRAIGAELVDAQARNNASRPEEPIPSSGHGAALAQIWTESMPKEADSIGMHDNFFDLGGDSIVAIQMVNKARATGLSLKVADLLENPVFSDLVAAVGRESQHGSEHRPIPVQPRDSDEAELSFAQRGLWFLEQLNPGTPAYNVSIAARLQGPLQLDALRAAFQALENRHETLRTIFKERNGAPVQLIQPYRSVEDTLQLIDIAINADYRKELQRQQTTAFDLKSSPPWRVAVLRLGPEDHIISIVMHHIISDGWSDEILRRNLGVFYSAAIADNDPLSALEPLPIQYRDFAAWQQHADQQNEQQRQLQYWTEQLMDSVPAELLIDKPRPALPSGRASVVQTSIDGSLYESMQQFCKAQQTTPFVVLLAAFRAAHYRLTGAEDATIGTPNASRNRPELEDLVGFFSNTQCLRIRAEGETFVELVQQVKATVTAALAHQDVPFERIVSEVMPGSRDASRNPLVQLMFAVHSQPSLGEIHLKGLEGEALLGTESTRFDLEFHLVQRTGAIHGNLLYAKELFEPETIHATLNIFKEVLRRGVEEPETPVASLRLTDGLDELRSRGLLDMAQEEYPRSSSIADVFSEQVKTSPQAVAVKDSSTQLTYAELDGKSNALAMWLRERGFAAETWIGVLASRSCETIVAFLGILKANMAYVPLDVEAPSSRLESILEAFTGPRLVLLGPGVQVPDIPLGRLEFVPVAKTLDQPGQGDTQLTGTQPSATSLAYVMFTSGSTGKPKGVMIEHRGVVRLVKTTNVLSQLPSSVAVAHIFNIAFDLSVWEIFTALLNGGTVVCIDSATKVDPNALEQVFAHEHIEAAVLPPVLLKACLANSPDMLKGLAAFYNSADRFDSHDAKAARKLVPGRVVNAYGPTENSVLSTIYDVSKDDPLTNGVPVGEPVSNSGAYVMDTNQSLVSMGVMGELVVTGDGVARGYTDASLDHGRFVEIEIDNAKMKAYRTGDRVRYRPKDGQIEFFGRMDRQMKIRGFRIEMAEIEHAMLKLDEVDDAAVVAHQRDGEDPDLIGFITVQNDTGVGKDEETSDQVETWGQQFDNHFYQGIEDIGQSILGNDFLGWTSMYDGSKIDRSEMQEWLSDSIKTMLDGQSAGRMLEIGTGTGMVLFSLGDGLENYVGIDPSKAAVKFASDKMQEVPGLADKTTIHTGTALDIDQIDSQQSELVVFNSVVQYFPSPEYLSEVVDAIAKLPHVKRLFFGDVRSYPLNRQFLASRALFKLGPEAAKTDMRKEMSRMKDREEELLVDPAFFTGLQSRMPDLVEHVEILPKRMKATNELSSYRYAVMVYFKRPNEQMHEIHTINEQDWVDFSAREMDCTTLGKLLEESKEAPVIAVSNIPYGKTIVERHIVKALDEEEDLESTDNEAWLSTATDSAKNCASLSALELVELGEKTGFRTEVSWARQSSQNGGLDAIFHRQKPSNRSSRVKFRFPNDKQPASISNRPLQGLRNIQVERRVRNVLQAQLPSYMVPRRVTVLDRMPLNANGKVDRKQLTKRAESAAVFKTTKSDVPPQNEEERVLCEEFSSVLGVDIGPEDDFFALGGHSLMAMRLLPKVSNGLGWHILLRDLYQNSTPRALYKAQTSKTNGSSKSEVPSYMEVHSRGSESQTTLILIHGFWGQGRIFSGLVPLIDDHLDIIILHDPFFGRKEGPQSLDDWSQFYFEALQARLPRDAKVILGGFSFGAFTALKMASVWTDWFDHDPLSVALLDPPVWKPVNLDEISQEDLDEQVNYALRMFGEGQRDFIMEHFKKFAPLLKTVKEKPVYKGKGLYIASGEMAKQEVPQWWATNYPRLEQHSVDSTHHGMLERTSTMEQVGQFVDAHCARILRA